MHLSVENEDHQSFSGFSGDAALTFLNLSWSFFSCCSNAFNFSSASFFVIFEGCGFGKSFLSFSCCFCLSFFFGSSFGFFCSLLSFCCCCCFCCCCNAFCRFNRASSS